MHTLNVDIVWMCYLIYFEFLDIVNLILVVFYHGEKNIKKSLRIISKNLKEWVHKKKRWFKKNIYCIVRNISFSFSKFNYESKTGIVTSKMVIKNHFSVFIWLLFLMILFFPFILIFFWSSLVVEFMWSFIVQSVVGNMKL